MTVNSTCIVALGCSGPVATPVLRGFLDEGVTLRVLARAPEPVARRYPEAEVVAGSMSDPVCVSRALADADAAFLMTPMGMRNDPTGEIAIAKQVLAEVARTMMTAPTAAMVGLLVVFAVKKPSSGNMVRSYRLPEAPESAVPVRVSLRPYSLY